MDRADNVGFLRVRPALDQLLEVIKLTLRDSATAGGSVRSEPEDVALLLENLLDLLEPDVIDHDAANLLERRLLHDSSDAGEALTHDGDEQIEEDQLHNNGGEDEHDPDHPRVVLRVEVLVEVTKASQIGVDDSINGRDANQGVKDRVFVLVNTVRIKDEDDIGEGHERNDEHDHEDFDVLDDLSNHPDEGTEWLEEAHPVEELEPHEHDGA